MCQRYHCHLAGTCHDELVKGSLRRPYYSVAAVSTWLAETHHINMSINLLTKSICEPTINKFVPIRNKLTQLCQWADEEEHNPKPINEPSVKSELNMMFLNQHGLKKKKREIRMAIGRQRGR